MAPGSARASSRAAIDGIAEEIVALNDDVADMDADAESHLLMGLFLRILLGYGVLPRDSALHGIDGAGEIGDETVARRGEDPTAMVMSRIRHAAIVPYPLGAGQKERPKYPEKSLSDNNS